MTPVPSADAQEALREACAHALQVNDETVRLIEEARFPSWVEGIAQRGAERFSQALEEVRVALSATKPEPAGGGETIKAAYQRGWDDRESDFLCAVDRIASPPVPEPEPVSEGAELLPCPWCGGSDLDFGNLGDDDSWYVECRPCGAGLHATRWKAQTVAAWNRRAPLPAGREAVEAAIADIRRETNWHVNDGVSDLRKRLDQVKRLAALAPAGQTEAG